MTLSLVMDIVVLLALGVTIFYAVRLSNSLNAFKQHRSEFDALIKVLSDNIEQAYRAIDELKDSSEKAGRDLQDALNDSQYMIDELRMVNDASDSLSRRLEDLAVKGRHVTSPAPSVPETPSMPEVSEEVAPAAEKDGSWQSTLSVKMRDDAPAPKAAKGTGNEGASIFSIRDPDHDADAGSNDAFSSKAEQELYEALQGKKR